MDLTSCGLFRRALGLPMAPRSNVTKTGIGRMKPPDHAVRIHKTQILETCRSGPTCARVSSQ